MDPATNVIALPGSLGEALLEGGFGLLASFLLFSALDRAIDSPTLRRWIWIAVAALAAGSSIVATHGLALHEHGAAGGRIAETGLSASAFVAAVAIATIGFAVAVKHSSESRFWLGGLIAGLSVNSVHFTSLFGEDELRWSDRLIGPEPLAVALGAALMALALRIGLHDSLRGPLYAMQPEPGRGRLRRRLLGVLLLSLSIVSAHVIGDLAGGDLAGGVQPSAMGDGPLRDVRIEWFAVATLLASILVLCIAFAGPLFDPRGTRARSIELARLQRLVNATMEGLVIHIDGKVLDVNEAMAHLTMRSVDDLIGSNAYEVIAPGCRQDVKRAVEENRLMAYESEVIRADGSTVPVEILGRNIDLNGRVARVAALRDISERRDSEQRIRHLAHHDGLTGLPNRSLFLNRLEHDLARVRRSAEPLAVICLGVDRFKEINDLYGHEVGDELLCKIANRLIAATRDSDTVARIGGDEFALIQSGAPQPNGSAQLAERILESFAEPHEINAETIAVSASIGISFHPQDGDSADILLLQTEKARALAKAEGGGKLRLFEPVMDSRLRERRQLESDLREAIETDALSLDYQQQVLARSGSVVGFEALARWRSSRHGNVSPGIFIPLAEETGLILQLGEWVLRRGCRDAVSWPGALRVGINLSPLQFKRCDLPAVVADVLEETGLEPQRLELEITEGVLIDDDESAFEMLRRLKDLGVRIAMDDFGTGYSSLSYLQRFPFDKIKIDQSFVRELQSRPDAKAIVRAVVGLGRSLDVCVIAEGVETEIEVELLREEGCQELQGYYFGRPMPLDQVHALLAQETGGDAGAKPSLAVLRA